jgi:hypothetical protein
MNRWKNLLLFLPLHTLPIPFAILFFLLLSYILKVVTNWECDDLQMYDTYWKRWNVRHFKITWNTAKMTPRGFRNAETTDDLDIMLCGRIAEKAVIEKSIEEFHVILKSKCNKTYRKPGIFKKSTTHKSVPWSKEELTILRKRTKVLRRRHQRTRNNTTSGKETNCNTSKARRNTQQ